MITYVTVHEAGSDASTSILIAKCDAVKQSELVSKRRGLTHFLAMYPKKPALNERINRGQKLGLTPWKWTVHAAGSDLFFGYASERVRLH